jgi:hypothetical protein
VSGRRAGFARGLVLLGATLPFCGPIGCWSTSPLDVTAGDAPEAAPPAPYACREMPLTYGFGEAPPELPAGPCTSPMQCFVRTRQTCDDGSIGVTSGYDCRCEFDVYRSKLWSWHCWDEWSTTASCSADGGTPLPDAGASVDAGNEYWIRVEGDGPTHELTYGSAFVTVSCGDTGLSGCYARNTPPCLETRTRLPYVGVYYDRNGDVWTLTPTSARSDPWTVSYPSNWTAEGLLEVDAVGPSGAAKHLVFAFRAPVVEVFCE